jgi:hypothetical protein
MKQSIPTFLIITSSILCAGCTTRKYVRQTVDPVGGKLKDETRTTLDQTRATLEKDGTALNAKNERAVSAGNHAGEAMAKATDASNKADTANQGVSALKTQLADTVTNLDASKQVAQTTVDFEFDRDKLDLMRLPESSAGSRGPYSHIERTG